MPPTQTSGVTDVVVVGGGAAGLSAAVRAASQGASTVLLEKADQPGGTTVLSVGSFTAAGTRLQRRHGIHDDSTAFLEDMMAFDPPLVARDNLSLRQVLASHAGEALDWLEGLGMVFAGPFDEPPHRVPRMHNAVPHSRMYRSTLLRAARRHGVRIVSGARVEALATDGGAVVGVQYRVGGRSEHLGARRGVVLAGGDFSANPQLRAQHLSGASAAAPPFNYASTGDAHELARRVGARLVNMDLTLGPKLRVAAPSRRGFIDRLPTWAWLARLQAQAVMRAPAALLRPIVNSLLVANLGPSRALFGAGAILVNAAGDRFCDETQSVDDLALQPGATGHIVMSQSIADRFNTPPNHVSTAPGIGHAYFRDYVRARPDLVRRASSVDDLAVMLGADRVQLGHAVASAPVDLAPPLIAIGPVRSHLIITEGGIAVDPQCRVLHNDNTPIPGLYAAGGCAQGGMILEGHGLHIAWAVTSGKLAAESAAIA